jgi:hypothetical protein
MTISARKLQLFREMNIEEAGGFIFWKRKRPLKAQQYPTISMYCNFRLNGDQKGNYPSIPQKAGRDNNEEIFDSSNKGRWTGLWKSKLVFLSYIETDDIQDVERKGTFLML